MSSERNINLIYPWFAETYDGNILFWWLSWRKCDFTDSITENNAVWRCPLDMTLLRHLQAASTHAGNQSTCIGTQSYKSAHKCKKKNQNWSHPIEADQSCIQCHISSWACRVHCVMNCLGWLAQSRKSAQGTETPFNITHHPMLLAALISTGQSCRELIGMSNFRDDNSTIAGFFFSFLFSSHLFSE